MLSIVCCCTIKAAAQSYPRGEKENFLRVIGNEQGPILEGEFGVFEMYFYFRGWNGDIFLPVHFKITDADSGKKFQNKLIVELHINYSLPVDITITDSKGNVVQRAARSKEGGYDYSIELPIKELMPGRYSMNFYSRRVYNGGDSLLHSVWFRKEDPKKKD